MDKRKLIALILLSANLVLWLYSPEYGNINIDADQAKIEQLGKTLPALEQIASWVMQVKEYAEKAPSSELQPTFNKLRAVAQAGGFVITEASNFGENPVKIHVTGNGSYRAFSAVINELNADDAVVIEKVSLEKRDDDKLEASIEALLRKGPWEPITPDVKRPVPIQNTSVKASLGKTDLFGTKAPVISALIPQTNIRYLGYFTESGSPSVVIEENGKTLLLNLGEKTPKGNFISKIDQSRIEITSQEESNGRKKTWTVLMEKKK